MPDTGHDRLYHIKLESVDSDIALTVHFAGGPITVAWRENSATRIQTFAADPFFRRPDRYITSGTVLLNTTEPGARVTTACILFTNATNSPKRYRIELSSPRRVDPASSPVQEQPHLAYLLAKSEEVPAEGSDHFVVVIEHD
jgi:hypothetical protein